MKHILREGIVHHFVLSDGSRFIITRHFDGTHKVECINGDFFFQNTYLLEKNPAWSLIKICREIKREASKK